MTKKKSSTSTGFGCMVLFLMPFLFSGLFMLGKGILTLATERRFSEDTVGMLGAGVVFTSAAVGFLSLFGIGARIAKKQSQLEAEHPDEPWMWRKSWVNGRIPSSTPLGMFVGWIFALAFCGASVPLVMKVGPELLNGGEAQMWIALLFPLVGVSMLIWAIYATLRWLKFGRAYCDLITHPGVVGGWFTAVVWAGYRHRDDDTAKAVLTCYHKYVTGSGKNRSTRRDVQWQEEHLIHQDGIGQDDQGKTALPVKMYLPRDCRPTTLENPNDCIEWELTVHSDVPGIDFQSAFIVPVFVTDESRDTPPQEDPNEEHISSRAPYKPSILIKDRIDGVELTAPPRRNVGTAISLSVFLTIWTGALVFLFKMEAGIIFYLGFGLFEVLIGWFVLWLWFGTVTLTIRNGTITLKKTMLGVGGTKTLDGGTVTEVDVAVGMTSNNRAFYQIVLIGPATKRTVTIGGIRNKQEGDDLAARIRDALGMDRD
jgi:hypothetical protein